jgi:hypothetical protein
VTRPTRTLDDLVRHLRNAVAHGRVRFSSDSKDPDDVDVFIEDRKGRGDAEAYWCAQINATDLRRFCMRFLDFIDDAIG